MSTPIPQMKRSDPAAQYFYHGMIKFEPNFKMAEDYWKLDRLATDIYFNWTRLRKDGSDVKQEVKVEDGSKKRKSSLSAQAPAGGRKKSKMLESSTSITSACKFNISSFFVSL